MCGVPYHALDAYLPKLLDAGMKVAIAEQMEDPKLAKNIVKREITRILTPGSILDSSCLKPGQNNFLCSLYSAQKNQYGFAWLDVSTGEFMTEELNSIGELESEIQRLQPKECIVSSSLHELWTKEKSFPFCCKSILWTPVEDWCFGLENTEDLLLRQFHVMSLDGFGLRGCPSAVRAAGAVLHYASENLRHSTGHIQTIRRNFYGDYLSLDPICQRNLELTESLHGAAKAGTLLELLDAASTAMGSRLMRDWILKPLRDVKKIQERQDVVALFLDDAAALAEIRESLQMIRDIERLISKLNVGAVNARDMIALGNSLSVLPGIRSILADFDMPYLNRLHDDISEFSELTERISKTISDDPPAVLTEGGIIRTGFNADLDELRSAATDGRKWVAELQAKEIERTGIKSLKVHYNKVFGYYIEVSNSNLEHVPEDYIRKQTLTNGERFITPELKEFESKILGAEDKSKAMEQTLFEELRQYAEGFTQKIQLSAKAVSELDVLCAL